MKTIAPNRASGLSRKLLVLCCALACAVTANSYAAPTDLYVTDLASGSVVRYAQDGSSSIFASGLISPQGIVFDQASTTLAAYFYVADAGDGGATSGVIYRYDRAGNRTTFATGLNNPIGLAIDGAAVLVSENGANRIKRLPINGESESISLIVNNPLGIDTRAFGQSGFTTKFVATGDSVLKVEPNSVPVDIDPNDASRSVSVDPVVGDVYVSTGAGTISKITPDGSSKTTFASGLTDPHGLAFVPPGLIQGQPGFVYVADTSVGIIFKIAAPGSTPLPFVTGAGNPNYLAFETASAGDPTPTPTPTPSVSPTPTPTPPGLLQNISTRAQVLTNNKVAIGGFIVTGTGPKTVLIRGIGPSLAAGSPPVANPLGDPVLELHNPDGTTITNDNWKDTQEAEITATMLAPSNDLESAILATLDPVDPAVPGSGEYTAILRGNNLGTGVALFEIYDLDDPAVTTSELANLSTRGFVGTSDNVLIGGFILGPESNDEQVLVRAIGPSIPPTEVTSPLADPTLELFNADGLTISFDDNWKDTQEDEITATGLAPTKGKESAILANLISGNYTAIVRGSGDTTGVALVEVYHLAPTAPVAQ